MVGLKLKLSKKRPSNRSALACLKITNKKVLEIYKKYLIYISKFESDIIKMLKYFMGIDGLPISLIIGMLYYNYKNNKKEK